jgi:hypothetical protein
VRTTEQHVTTARLVTFERQRGTGAPVVFVHGFPQTSYQWRHQMAALADAGYACFAPDNRGFGGTYFDYGPDDRSKRYPHPTLWLYGNSRAGAWSPAAPRSRPATRSSTSSRGTSPTYAPAPSGPGTSSVKRRRTT